MTRTISIDPITRLEGHGRIALFLNDAGDLERAWLQVPELRGFEKFVEGRPAEDMPQITSRICGVCPTAHHMASVKALDAVFSVTPPPAARKLRELFYSMFFVEDHALHFFYLGGPDFVVGPTAPASERNVLGLIARLGLEAGKRVISVRRRLRELMARLGGKAAHPVLGLPGGVARALREDERQEFRGAAGEAVEFARFSLETFERVVLANSAYVDMILSDAFTERTHSLGMVDNANCAAVYEGHLRVVSPEGEEVARFEPAAYQEHIGEHAEPWTFMKFCYLQSKGWTGLNEGSASGVYAVGPLARLNAADSMATPLAEQACEKLFETLGGKPVHHTLANHWARLVEMLAAAERMRELTADDALCDPCVRTLPEDTPREGVGVVEAPRGTLIHHYQTDERGILRKANLVVATQNNAARIAMSIEKAAREFVHGGTVSEGILNKVEMAFRAYDPCMGCATHSLAGALPVALSWHDRQGRLLGVLRRNAKGQITKEAVR